MPPDAPLALDQLYLIHLRYVDLGLGLARLAMGVPLYAAVLWIAWLISRPAAVDPDVPEDALQRSDSEPREPKDPDITR